MSTESFEYYMVRVRRSGSDPQQVTGHVERLGTGEKRGFGSGEDLIRLVASWPAADRDPASNGTVSAVHPDTRRPSHA